MEKISYSLRAEVLENSFISPQYYLITLSSREVAKEARPGQFVLVRGWSGYDPLLARPMSINEVYYDAGRPKGIKILFQVVGRGTQLLSLLSPGDEVYLRGPLGNGFPLSPTGKAILIAGGIGVSPLLFLASELKKGGSELGLLIGGKSEEDILLVQSFEKLGVMIGITTEDGSSGRKGVVTELVEERLSRGEELIIYACGPEGMLKEVARLSQRYRCKAYLSLERRMACGIGACLGCAVKIKKEGREEMVRVCREGPVFSADEVLLDG
jgi:dihydroorotate dehydrogenase electron transfer subunit